MHIKSLVALAALLVGSLAQAHSYTAGSLKIDHPAARATMGNMSNGAAFVQIENTGNADDALLSVSSPAAASVEVHSMSMEGDVMKMRAIEQLDIKAGSKVEMKPGNGYHIMLLGLKKPLKLGDEFPLTLTFKKAGKVKVSVHVEEMTMPAKPMHDDEDMHEHHHHEH
jgi:copper(I)-binding protein